MWFIVSIKFAKALIAYYLTAVDMDYSTANRMIL